MRTKRNSSKSFDLANELDDPHHHVNLAYRHDETQENELNNKYASNHVIAGMAYCDADDTSTKFTADGPSGQKSNCTPMTYTWENLEAEVDMVQGNCFNRKKKPTTRKRILDNVTGAARPGEFLAIMGASGAGKTTLLNCLTFRNSGNLKIRGKRQLNGAEVDRDSLASISGYVQQDDLFIGALKVKEVLRFQALLRMDQHITYAERMARVEEVIVEFGLMKCRNTSIGYPEKGIKGISGGERKRLAFACEVLTNPSVMFCDEPTSGLDSYMAQNVVQALRNLAQQGKTVICTIHQPSSEVFEMFDRILLMAEGRTAFLGPIVEALHFFSSNGMQCPTNYNPADFYIFTLAVVPGHESDCKQKVKAICDAYENSQARQRVDEIVRRKHNADRGATFAKKKSGSPYRVGWFTQFGAVLWRSWLSILRDQRILLVKRSASVLIALFIALIFRGQSLDAKSVQNVQGVLFFFLVIATVDNVFAVINTFSFEVPIFLREHFNGMYRTDVYFLSKTIAELLVFILFPFIVFVIPYYPIGLNPEVDRFFIGAGIVILVANVSASFGYFISCFASTPAVAISITSPMIMPMLLFGGFLLKNGSVPVYLDWFRYLSWFMYGFEALSINQWHNVTFETKNSQCAYANLNGTTIIPPCLIDSEKWQTIIDVFTGYQNSVVCNGDDILEEFNFHPDYFLRDILCLCALILGFRILAFLSLLRKTYQKH